MGAARAVVHRLAAFAALLTVGAALAAVTAGLPWLMWQVTGWPLPRHLPSLTAVKTALTGTVSDRFILDVITCAGWAGWAWFFSYVLAEAAWWIRHLPELARGSVSRARLADRAAHLSPPRALATLLAGGLLLGLLTAVRGATAASLTPVGTPVAAVPAVAAAAPGPAPRAAWSAIGTSPASVSGAAARAAAITAVVIGSPQPAPAASSCFHMVAEGDDLWDIARTDVGNALRWPEIYALNRGRPQPGGGRLTNPNDIYPGWILRLPPGATCHHPPPGRRNHHGGAPRHLPGHLPPARTPAPSLTPPRPYAERHPDARRALDGHPAPQPQHGGPAHHRARPVGIGLPSGGVAGITFAAAVSAAVVAWRLHRRRAAIPRWPIPAETAEPPLPPAIAKLRRAHLASLDGDAAEARGEPWPRDGASDHASGTGEGLDEFGAPTGPAAAPGGTPPAMLAAPVTSPPHAAPPAAAEPAGDPGDAEQPPPPGRPLPGGPVAFGMRGSTEIPLTAVAGGGLGLTGPGAAGAARALMLALLATPGPASATRVVIPAADAGQLTGDPGQAPQLAGVDPGPPPGLAITPTVAGALARLETEITRRIRTTAGTGGGPPPVPPLALIATPDPAAIARIKAVLDAGASAGVVGILLGGWPAGTTCRIGAAGIVTTATRAGLTGMQAFHLPESHAADLLSLLRGASGHVRDDRPATPTVQPSTARPPRAPAQLPVTPETAAHPDRDATPPATPSLPTAEHTPGTPHPAPPGRETGAKVPAGGGTPATRDTAPDGRGPASGQPTPGPGAVSPSAPGPAAAPPVRLSVLGPLRITAVGTEIQGGLRKARELLAYLAVHPEGATGEAVSGTLWPDATPRYATAQRNLALRKAREMLRTATGLAGAMFIVMSGGRYQLDPELIDVDLWRFTAALAAARAAATEEEQLAALRRATALYHGTLADGGYEWAERDAEPARRQALDAQARIAALLAGRDPEQALAALETALTHDRYNEAIYEQIMDLQTRLGRPDAARRTRALLETRLAELGQPPGPGTRLRGAGRPASLPGRSAGSRRA